MTKKKNILIYENNKKFVNKIRNNVKGKNVKLNFINSKSVKNLKNLIVDTDALINLPRSIFNSEIFRKGKKLKWIHNGGAGIETFLFDDLVKSKVTFTNGKILQGPSVSDHAIGILLTFTRNLNHQFIKKKSDKIKRPIELKGKVCGIFSWPEYNTQHGLVVFDQCNIYCKITTLQNKLSRAIHRV